MASTVLIITNDHDEHATPVIEELYRRNVSVLRFHPEEFPHASSISIAINDGRVEGEISNGQFRTTFDDICAAWYRRSRNLFKPSTDLNLLYGDLDNYVRVQSVATLAAVYTNLDTLWVSNPFTLRRAEIKALQLAQASRAGLKTPDTLISNDTARVAAFVGALGNTECAVKPLNVTRATVGEEDRLPLTTILPPGHPLDSVAVAPTIFQPYIKKAYELRCVVIGDKIFCARLNSQADEATRTDWRAGDPKQEVFDLPGNVQASVRRLMRSFGLNFASIDLIVTPSGEFVFLDLNPNGQWLWLEADLGLPMVSAMADLLMTNYSRPAQPAASEKERPVEAARAR
jgi:glutathione synthase/RimK-type ligase-like ATP-grasp enzyme